MRSRTVARRSPSALLFFPEATEWELTRALDEVAERFELTTNEHPEWAFPSNAEWLVLVRIDDKALDTCAPPEKERLREEVGAAPATTIGLLVNGWMLDEGCDAARLLVLHLLGKFYGVADERCGQDPIWNVEQVRAGKDGVAFLQCYRRRDGR